MSDVLGILLFSAFGLWWLFWPASVLRFYAWFHGRPVSPRPTLLGVRLAGLLWALLVVVVSLVQISKRR